MNNSLPSGSFAITASYTSDNESLFYDSVSATGTNVLVSSSTVNATKMDFTLSPSTVTVGQNVSFHVTVTAVDANGNPTGTVPTGNVDFSAGPTGASGQNLFASYELDSSGSVDFTYNGLVAGDYVVVATYPGDSGDGGITGQLPLDILPGTSPIATTTTVGASPSSITTGQTTTLSAHVVEAAGQTPPAGGEVDFFAGPGRHEPQLRGLRAARRERQRLRERRELPGRQPTTSARSTSATAASNIQGSRGDNSLLVTASSSGGGGGGRTRLRARTPGRPRPPVGAQVTLTGHLDKADGSPLSGEPLTLSLGSQSCVTARPPEAATPRARSR